MKYSDIFEAQLTRDDYDPSDDNDNSLSFETEIDNYDDPQDLRYNVDQDAPGVKDEDLYTFMRRVQVTGHMETDEDSGDSFYPESVIDMETGQPLDMSKIDKNSWNSIQNAALEQFQGQQNRYLRR